MYTKKFIQNLISEAFKETIEATSTGSSGSFEPLFGDVEEENNEEEFTEATSSSSSGSYETASFLAKDLKNWGPSKRTQIPGGQFVSVKEKCKTFPYCNQGIGALEFSNSKTKAIKNLTKRKPKKKRPLDEAIHNVSLKTGLSEQEIKNIILSVINR
jgi:hypothetical protein